MHLHNKEDSKGMKTMPQEFVNERMRLNGFKEFLDVKIGRNDGAT